MAMMLINNKKAWFWAAAGRPAESASVMLTAACSFQNQVTSCVTSMAGCNT